MLQKKANVKMILSCFIAIITVFSITGTTAMAQSEDMIILSPPDTATIQTDKPYAEDRLIIKLKNIPISQFSITSTNDAGLDALMEDFNIKKAVPLMDISSEDCGTASSEFAKFYLLELPSSSDVESAVTAFSSASSVEYAEPDYWTWISKTPNDATFDKQWNLNMIQAPEGWDISVGSSTQVLAILDTGVNLNHSDLKAKIVSGYDFINNDSDPSDDQGHGSHVAGIAAAITNNTIGIAGIAWDCRIMPVKVLNNNGSGNYSALIQGIAYAVNRGASVINMSLGGDADSQSLHDAIKLAYNAGIPVVAATGNKNTAISYPAKYNEVIAVGATGHTDVRAPYSNYGAEIDLVAPGGYGAIWDPSEQQILSTYVGSNNTYAWLQGTSMATPHVTGAIGILKSICPNLTPEDLRKILRDTADDKGTAGWDQFYGAGRLNLNKAVLAVVARNISVNPTSHNFGSVMIGASSLPKKFTITNTENGCVGLEISQLLLSGTNSSEFKIQNNTCPAKLSAGSSCTFEVVFSPISVGSKTASVSISSNDSDTPTVKIPLNAQAVVPTYPLTVTKNGTGAGTVISSPAGISCGADCAQSYTTGTVVTLTATPNSCSAFTGWSGGCSGTGNCQVTINAAKSVVATFTSKTYKITASAGSGGTILPSGEISQNCGTSRTFTITPASCYRISNVLVDGKSVGAVTSYTFANISQNHTIQPIFTKNSYTITASAGTGGTISPVGAVSVGCGTDKTFIITPNAGYTIARILVNGISVGAVTSYKFSNVSRNHTIQAVFTPPKYTLRVTATGTGTGTVTSSPAGISCGGDCAESYNVGTKVTLSATPHVGSTFTGWSGGGCSGTGNCIVTMDSAKTVTATFGNVPLACPLTPTIESVSSGSWTNSNIWNPKRIPTWNDVVLIQPGHTITAPQQVFIRSLCNHGQLWSEWNRSIAIYAYDSINNYGQIRGKDGILGRAGSSVILRGSPVNNYAGSLILAGNGAYGSCGAGQGGSVLIYGINTTNYGTIQAGRGGNTSSRNLCRAGNGGAISIWGHTWFSRLWYNRWGYWWYWGWYWRGGYGYFQNRGIIRSGDGGDGGCGGSAGGISLMARPWVNLSGGQIYSGRPGRSYFCIPPRRWTRVDPNMISLAGSETKIEAEDLLIYGGNDWVMDLSDMEEGAITATGDITLAVGTGSEIDFRGTTGKVLKAEGKVEIFSDSILLDEGITLSDVIEATEIIVQPAKILYAASLNGPGNVVGEPDTKITITLTLANEGPEKDIYTLSVSDSAGWNIGTSESETTVEGLDITDLDLEVTLPSDIGEENIITIKAVSQSDPSIVEEMEVKVIVGLSSEDDSDGDNVADDEDAFPDDPNEWKDTDYDGIGDNADTDDDDDGMPDEWENQYDVLNPLVDDASEDPDNDGLSNLEEYEKGTDPTKPESDFTAGVFTVGADGIVKVEWLYDGGMYKGELGIFSLSGMEAYTPNSTEFIKEAVRRALSDSKEGYLIISDWEEGARFTGSLGEPRDWNSGDYKGEKEFDMTPGDTFATILVPNSTLQTLLADPGTTNAYIRPLFSLASSNPEHDMYVGQIADINGMGTAFVYEDKVFTNSDKDYNDFIFRISGAVGEAPALDTLIDPAKDWRGTTTLGEELITYTDTGVTKETRWITVTLKSPAELTVYDALEGIVNKSECSIPGAKFEVDENSHQVISLYQLESDEYRIMLKAIGGGGLCHLEISGYEGVSEIASQETPFDITGHQILKTVFSASSFLDDEAVSFDTPKMPRSPEGKVLIYDFDGNGAIDDADVKMVRDRWNAAEGEPEYDSFYDFNADGIIDMRDIRIVEISRTDR